MARLRFHAKYGTTDKAFEYFYWRRNRLTLSRPELYRLWRNALFYIGREQIENALAAFNIGISLRYTAID